MNYFMSVSEGLLLLLSPDCKVHDFIYPYHVQKISNRVFAILLQTKWDFTFLWGVLISLLFVLLTSGIILIFLPQNRMLNLLYSSLGALVYCVYLVYDVQMIAGGRKYEFEVDDYVPAALAVYLDIINLFLALLKMGGNQ